MYVHRHGKQMRTRSALLERSPGSSPASSFSGKWVRFVPGRLMLNSLLARAPPPQSFISLSFRSFFVQSCRRTNKQSLRHSSAEALCCGRRKIMFAFHTYTVCTPGKWSIEYVHTRHPKALFHTCERKCFEEHFWTPLTQLQLLRDSKWSFVSNPYLELPSAVSLLMSAWSIPRMLKIELDSWKPELRTLRQIYECRSRDHFTVIKGCSKSQYNPEEIY